jgi:multicomponent Na+:H+ antiporter subunit D
MTMIEQLPVINLLLLLSMALAIPLFRKRSFGRTLFLGFVVLLVVLAFSIVLLISVNQSGNIHYVFGNHERFYGIELVVSPFSAFFTTFIVSLMLPIYLYSTSDSTEGIEEREYGRYYVLLFILLFSMFGILYTNDLFNTYVFIEILSITTCSIISIKRKKETYTSAFRYVMLNEIGSLSYLFGVALLYMITGYTNMSLVGQELSLVWQTYTPNIIIAIAFMIVGLGIKAAIFPFHIWLPDAHASAPSTSSAILSGIVVKVYVLVLVKVLFVVFGLEILQALNISLILMILASVGMIMGSVFAIAQKDIKRMLGYSSVAQIGYIVMGIGLLSSAGLSAAFFHIISHAFMKAALFLSVGIAIFYKHNRSIKGFEGLAYHMPVSLTVFSLAAFGMIGLPLTSGFISKLYLGLAVLDANKIFYLVIIVISGLLNVVYYFPIIIAAFLKDNPEKMRVTTIEHVPRLMLLPIIMLGAFILFLGVYPAAIMHWIEAAVESIL